MQAPSSDSDTTSDPLTEYPMEGPTVVEHVQAVEPRTFVDFHAVERLVLFNEICGPKYFDEDEHHAEAPVPRICSVHGDVPEDAELHTNLTQLCAINHYDDNLRICTPCLQEHLKSSMFPLGSGDIKQRFPATTVRCWAPGCFIRLSHCDIQKHADPEVFEVYDQALCLRALAKDDSVLQCAFPSCQGLTWVDGDTVKDLRRFRCPDCCRETCRECNDLYEKHQDRPCPTKMKQLSVKTRLEELASQVRVSGKHKCPRCPTRYEKDGGCDHITCGGSSWTDQMQNGCSHEFCHRCKGEWETDGHAPYCIYYYRPRHIRHLFRRIWRRMHICGAQY